jgi:hypothetical protein
MAKARGDTVAALYVQTGGAYYDLPGVDPWDEQRDARKYDGPWPVVAHPPCARWGRYWHGGPSSPIRKVKGDDDGCFASALAAVRRFGGVLEHPEASHAWAAHGLMTPPRGGGWVVADWLGGWTCCVEQGHYGHRARKPTWLYVNGARPPILKWGKSAATVKIDAGFHSAEERRNAKAAGWQESAVERLSKHERLATPPAFRDVLISIARSVRQEQLRAG